MHPSNLQKSSISTFPKYLLSWTFQHKPIRNFFFPILSNWTSFCVHRSVFQSWVTNCPYLSHNTHTHKGKDTEARKKQVNHHQKYASYKSNFETKVTTLTEQNKEQLLRCRQPWQVHGKDPNFTTILNEFPQTLDKSVHGFHWNCYQAFTNLKYIQTIQHAETQQEEKNDTDKPSTSKRRRISDLKAPEYCFHRTHVSFVTKSKSDCVDAPGTKNLWSV